MGHRVHSLPPKQAPDKILYLHSIFLSFCPEVYNSFASINFVSTSLTSLLLMLVHLARGWDDSLGAPGSEIGCPAKLKVGGTNSFVGRQGFFYINLSEIA